MKAQSNLSPHQIYEQQKRIAILLEKTNNSHLIAFPSIPNKDGKHEWYKLGGNSAYYYKYIIAPRLGKKPPTIHPDTDLNYRFRDGVVLIHWKSTLTDALTKLHYEIKEESNLLIFNLNHTFAIEEIKKLKQLEKTNRENQNKLFRPKHADPSIYNIIIELSRIIPVKSQKIKPGFQTFYTPSLNQDLLTLRKVYQSYANGRLEKSSALQQLYSCVDSLSATLAILTDNNCLDITSQSRISRLLASLEVKLDKASKNGR